MPGDEVRADFETRFDDQGPVDAELVDMARSYGVSSEALLWRLRNLGLMSEEAVRERLSSDEFRRIDRGTMPTHWSDPPIELPDRFVRLVGLAYQAGALSRSVAAKYLETNPGELYYLDWDEENGSPTQAAPS
jgi:Zn-dependent peptidase ImmA (M78 family)